LAQGRETLKFWKPVPAREADVLPSEPCSATALLGSCCVKSNCSLGFSVGVLSGNGPTSYPAAQALATNCP